MPPSRTSVLQGRERVSDKPAVTAEAEAEKLLPCKEPRHCRVAQDNGRCVWFGCQGGMRPAVAQALATKNARIAALEAALNLALEILVKFEPGDSRAVSNEFVAMAAVACNLDDQTAAQELIRTALSAQPGGE